VRPAWSGVPGMLEWCQINCKVNRVAADTICICVSVPLPSNPEVTVKESHAGVPGMLEWCIANCGSSWANDYCNCPP